MTRKSLTTIVLLALLPLAPAPADGDTLAAALAGGEALVDIRARLELVDQPGLDEEAVATTVRSRIGYHSGEWQQLRGLVELWDNRVVGATRYRSSGVDRLEYPVVADPEASGLNRAWLQYEAGGRGWLRAGRQRIVRGDARFIGNVGFRQTEQRFDAVGAQLAPREALELFVAWLGGVQRIFGPQHPDPLARAQDLMGWLVEASGEAGPVDGVLFAHLVENRDIEAASYAHFGVRLASDHAAGEGRTLRPRFTVAHQAQWADSPDRGQWYTGASLGLEDGPFGATLGFEQLGADDDGAFATPFATLHAFNGAADRFLATPADGLRDFHAKLAWRPGPWKLAAAGHLFHAARGSTTYGQELDLSASRPLVDGVAASVKLALYAAEDDGGSAPWEQDTTKLWFTLQLAP